MMILNLLKFKTKWVYENKNICEEIIWLPARNDSNVSPKAREKSTRATAK